MNLLGFQFAKPTKDPYESPAVIPPSNEDSAIQYEGMNGFISPYSSVFDFDSTVREERQLIEKYRELARNVQEVTSAVEEICDEAIIVDDKSTPVVSINLDQTNLSDDIKEMVEDAFEKIINILNFHKQGYEIFRNWYIDGRVYYYIMIDNDAPENGIRDLRYIDPRKLKKVREVVRSTDNELGVSAIVDVKEYYIYSDNPFQDKAVGVTNGYQYNAAQNAGNTSPIPMTADVIAGATSGIYDPNRNMVLSYLHMAIRAANNLRMMEDAMLIYRLTRAPERRVFYIDTGDIPASKREQYVQDIANKYRNKIQYDAQTGAIKNDKRYLSMTEDYWIPRPSGSSGTEIDTLEGGQSVGETNDVEYFLDRMYTALRIPKSRFADTPTMFSSGMEITRDEIRFNRFISRLRNRFSSLFEELVGREVVLTQIMTKEEWEAIKVNINFDYQEDNLFSESMKAQSLTAKINILTMMEPYVGKYFDPEYVFKKVLDLTDEEIENIQDGIENMDPRYLPMEVQMQQMQMANMMAQTDAVQNPPQTTEEAMAIFSRLQEQFVQFRTDNMFRKLGIKR